MYGADHSKVASFLAQFLLNGPHHRSHVRWGPKFRFIQLPYIVNRIVTRQTRRVVGGELVSDRLVHWLLLERPRSGVAVQTLTVLKRSAE